MYQNFVKIYTSLETEQVSPLGSRPPPCEGKQSENHLQSTFRIVVTFEPIMHLFLYLLGPKIVKYL